MLAKGFSEFTVRYWEHHQTCQRVDGVYNFSCLLEARKGQISLHVRNGGVSLDKEDFKVIIELDGRPIHPIFIKKRSFQPAKVDRFYVKDGDMTIPHEFGFGDLVVNDDVERTAEELKRLGSIRLSIYRGALMPLEKHEWTGPETSPMMIEDFSVKPGQGKTNLAVMAGNAEPCKKAPVVKHSFTHRSDNEKPWAVMVFNYISRQEMIAEDRWEHSKKMTLDTVITPLPEISRDPYNIYQDSKPQPKPEPDVKLKVDEESVQSKDVEVMRQEMQGLKECITSLTTTVQAFKSTYDTQIRTQALQSSASLASSSFLRGRNNYLTPPSSLSLASGKGSSTSDAIELCDSDDGLPRLIGKRKFTKSGDRREFTATDSDEEMMDMIRNGRTNQARRDKRRKGGP